MILTIFYDTGLEQIRGVGLKRRIVKLPLFACLFLLVAVWGLFLIVGWIELELVASCFLELAA